MSAKPIPCVELRDHYPDLTMLKDTLPQWRPFTDTACVLLEGDPDTFYPALRAALPDWTIIPGVKANATLAGHIDDLERWAALARVIGRHKTATGSHRCWIEAETAVKIALRQSQWDWVGLAIGLRSLPCGIIWYPSVFGVGTELMRREQLCTVLLSSVRFFTWTTQSWCDRGNPENLDAQVWQHWLDRTGHASMPILYTYPQTVRPQSWAPSDVPDLLRRMPFAEALIYPGRAAFAEQSAAIVAALNADEERYGQHGT